MSDTYEVIVVHEDGRVEWVPCLDAKELDDGRLAAEVLLGNVIFRKPGRWRKVPSTTVQKEMQSAGTEVHIRPEIQSLIARGNVTPAELAELRCNSWEWEALVPALNDEAFVERMQHSIDNCFARHDRPFATYNDAVQGLWAPELLKRFASATRAARDYAETIDNVRQALGLESTHYLVIAGDVKDLVEAIESRSDAMKVLKRIREESK